MESDSKSAERDASLFSVSYMEENFRHSTDNK